MFRSFFLNRKWMHWSIAVSLLILGAIWYRVQLDVQINEWFGTFYNGIQQILKEPGTVTFGEFSQQLLTFARIAAIYVLVAVLTDFVSSHYVFRWRTAMTEFYVANWDRVRHIEGASQRIQEDTMRFAKITESLGESLLRSILTLVAFLPLLWDLGKNVTELPWIGHVDHGLMYLAILLALFGTVVLAVVGIKLPGLEFNNQRVEAAYRKELVLGEDDAVRAQPPKLGDLFTDVRRNYFKLYLHYMYFNVVRHSYLQFAVVVPYFALGPSLIAGALTLGLMQQIIRAFDRVERAFQFLVISWPTIIELMSIYKRLKGFEKEIKRSN